MDNAWKLWEKLKEYGIDIECDWKISGKIDEIMDGFWEDWLDIGQSLVGLKEIERILDWLDNWQCLVSLREIEKI